MFSLKDGYNNKNSKVYLPDLIQRTTEKHCQMGTAVLICKLPYTDFIGT